MCKTYTIWVLPQCSCFASCHSTNLCPVLPINSCSCVDPIVLMMSLQLVTIYMYKNGVYIIFVWKNVIFEWALLILVSHFLCPLFLPIFVPVCINMYHYVVHGPENLSYRKYGLFSWIQLNQLISCLIIVLLWSGVLSLLIISVPDVF